LYYIYILRQNILKTTNKNSPKIGQGSVAPFGDRDRRQWAVGGFNLSGAPRDPVTGVLWRFSKFSLMF